MKSPFTIQEKEGYLYAVVSFKDEAGKTKYKWLSTGLKARGNRKAAKKVAVEKVAEFQKQLSKKQEKFECRVKPKVRNNTDATILFTDYCEKYIDSRRKHLSEQTYYIYKIHYMKLFRIYFDKQKLRLIDITEEELKGFYTFAKARGVKNISLKHYNNVLRPALRTAYRDKLIPDNPFEYLEPIKKEKTKLSFYDQNEMKFFLKAIKGHPLEIPFMLAAYYGLRRSEVLGLRWSAIDFEHKLININHKLIVVEKSLLFQDQLKTSSSNRTLPLIPVVEDALKKHKLQIEENQKYYGSTYDKKYVDYVCVKENGKMVYPDHMTKKFSDLLVEKGLRHIRLHDLRHSCASNLLANGIQIKEIQEWLGHASFGTTADVYSHLDFSSKVRVANTLFETYSQTKEEIDSMGEDELKRVAKKIQVLGFETVSEYLSYLERQDKEQEREIEM